jgi:hypothetical protein
MMTAVIHDPQYPSSRVSLDGYLVPNLRATKVGDFEYNLIVGNRYAALIHVDDLEDYVFLLANAMAIAAGYTSHGKHSRRANPYKVQTMEIGSVDTDADEPPQDASE